MKNINIIILIITFILYCLLNINTEYFENNEWINDIWRDTDLNPKDIYFVQIGSNCGTKECAVCGEPIWDDCKKNMWSGIVVEPVPEIFKKLKKNYEYNINVKAVNCAVSDKNGYSKLYTDSKGTEASSLLETHADKHKLDKKIINVKTYNLSNFWKKYVKNDKVDILNLDCEGYDHIIILSADFSKLNPKPKYILYESKHIPTDDKKKVLNHLNKFNYKFVKNTNMDTLVKLF